jgi:hypothetical protein
MSYTIDERRKKRQMAVNAFQCDENIEFLERCLIHYFNSPFAHQYIRNNIDDLVANFDADADMRFADPSAPFSTSINEIRKCMNKQFLKDRILLIQELVIKDRMGNCTDTNSRKYILRDGKIKNRQPYPRVVGPVNGSDLPRNDYNNGQPRMQFWRYGKDQTRVDSWNFPKKLDQLRDDSTGIQTYRGSHLADIHDMGSDYDIGATQYNTPERMKAPRWRGSGGGCVPRQYYETTCDPNEEPVYEYGELVPQKQSQTNEDDGNYHHPLHDDESLFSSQSGAHHLDRLHTTSIQDLNDDRAWDGDKVEQNTLFGDDVHNTNNYNTVLKNGSSVESLRSHAAFDQKKVFRNDNKFINRAISRRHERDVEESIGGAEFDFKIYKHDMDSLHCMHARDACGPRPFNDPFNHRYKSNTPAYLGLDGKPVYYPADRPAPSVGY